MKKNQTKTFFLLSILNDLIRSQLVLPNKQNATFQKWETCLFVFGTALARSIPNSRARLIEKGSLNGSTLIIVYYLSRLKLTFLVAVHPLNSQFSILATCLCWWNLLFVFFLTLPSPIQQREIALTKWQVRGSWRLLLKLVAVTAAAKKEV